MATGAKETLTVVFQNDESSAHGRDLGEPGLEGTDDRLGGGKASWNVPLNNNGL
jgi:hypothetical protein